MEEYTYHRTLLWNNGKSAGVMACALEDNSMAWAGMGTRKDQKTRHTKLLFDTSKYLLLDHTHHEEEIITWAAETRMYKT